MRFTPHDYQRTAIDWILNHPRCLLFLEMGLGKTIICLSAIERLIRYGEVSRVLVIAPKKVAESTWSDEAERWDHLSLRVANAVGTPAQRKAVLESDAEVCVISRDQAVWITEQYPKLHERFDMVIIDELTSFKNPASLRFKAMKRTLPKLPRVVGLTGTPTPNGLIDLWAQVYCVDSGERLGKYITHYRDRYFHYKTLNNVPMFITPKQGAQEEIMSKLSDISLSMRTEDWLTLPPLLIEDVPVRLPEKVMKDYRKFEAEKIVTLQESGEITAESAATMINRLSQFANGAIYTDATQYDTPYRPFTELHDAKLAALEEIFFSEEEEPLLVFYQYKHDAIRITRHFRDLKTRGGGGIHIGQNSGTKSGKSEIQLWNEGRFSMFLAHPSSMAFGLNMQRGGNRIVWFSTGWNLELYQQANARLHRQGQTRRVRVFNLIAKDTVDERMIEAIRGKAETQQGVVMRLARGIIAQNPRN